MNRIKAILLSLMVISMFTGCSAQRNHDKTVEHENSSTAVHTTAPTASPDAHNRKIGDDIENAENGMGNAVEDAGRGVGEAAEGIGEGAKDTIEGAGEAVGDVFDGESDNNVGNNQ